MNHPYSRSERRAVRDCWIRRRKKLKLRVEASSWERHWRTPHEGSGNYYSNTRYDAYLKYLEYENFNDEQKKIAEFEAYLDGKKWPPDDMWQPVQWSEYAKKSTFYCPCYNCRRDRSHDMWSRNTESRREAKKEIREYLLEPPERAADLYPAQSLDMRWQTGSTPVSSTKFLCLLK